MFAERLSIEDFFFCCRSKWTALTAFGANFSNFARLFSLLTTMNSCPASGSPDSPVISTGVDGPASAILGHIHYAWFLHVPTAFQIRWHPRGEAFHFALIRYRQNPCLYAFQILKRFLVHAVWVGAQFEHFCLES